MIKVTKKVIKIDFEGPQHMQNILVVINRCERMQPKGPFGEISSLVINAKLVKAVTLEAYENKIYINSLFQNSPLADRK